jgi:hypothetical protein
MYSEMDSSDRPAARETQSQSSSFRRKYRLGVCPVAGLPRPRLATSFTMQGFYDHPEKLLNRLFIGWTSNGKLLR